MSIPFNTTLISVLRYPNAEPYEEEPNPVTVASGVRAHISTGKGEEQVAGGQQEIVEFRMSCDPVDLEHTDRVKDDNSGVIYDVSWSHQRVGIHGMEHTQAGLKKVEGIISRPRQVNQ